MKTVTVPAGTRQRVLQRNFSSIPTDFQFEVAPTQAGQPVSGKVEVKGSRWIFPKPVATQPLQAQNTVSAGYWDTFYSVWITPDTDVIVQVQGRSKSLMLILILGFVVIAIAAALALISG